MGIMRLQKHQCPDPPTRTANEKQTTDSERSSCPGRPCRHITCAMCFDSEPSSIAASQSRKDSTLREASELPEGMGAVVLGLMLDGDMHALALVV